MPAKWGIQGGGTRGDAGGRGERRDWRRGGRRGIDWSNSVGMRGAGGGVPTVGHLPREACLSPHWR